MGVRFSVSRIDSRNVRPAPGGGIVVSAVITKAGVFEYRADDGSMVREYRPRKEVAHADALASYAGAPVTDHHRGMVTPDNYSTLSKGHVGDRVDADIDGMVTAELYINDRLMVDAVLSGERVDVSSAYNAVVEDSAGNHLGQPYDRVQRQIRGNHVALLPPGAGRLGAEVSIRLDGNDDEVFFDEKNVYEVEKKMAVIRYRGIEYSVDGDGAETLRQAIGARESEVEKGRGELDAKLAAEKTRADGLVAEVEGLKQETSVEAIDAKARCRAAVIDNARKVLNDSEKDFGVLPEREIMMSALGDGCRADASDDYVKGAFDAKVQSVQERSGQEVATDSSKGLDRVRAAANLAGAGVGDQQDRMDAIEQKFLERSRNAWKQGRK